MYVTYVYLIVLNKANIRKQAIEAHLFLLKPCDGNLPDNNNNNV